MQRFQSIVLAITLSFSINCQAELSFAHDVRPILSDKCFKCHGPDEANNKSDLRLDTYEHATKDLGGYAGITPGDLTNSEVSYVINTNDEHDIMPPVDSKMKLTKEEKQTLDQWIKEGANYEKHWAFEEIRESITIPESQHPSPKTAIDHFIAEKLKPLDILPSEETNRAQWLRRVSFDLTGLPPTLEELDNFITNSSVTAYEDEAQRLLSSQAYAERMTTEWLDVARYSDSYGYQVDKNRDVWRWRDWVIGSFQSNQPYNEFIIHQIAGDLIPAATQESKLATAFNRLHGQKSEGGSDPEEFRQAYISDRVNTVGTAFMGLTMECTKCHDHKYDPLTQEDYFSMAAFFSNIDEFGLYAFHHIDSIPTPSLTLSTPEDETKSAVLLKKITSIEKSYTASLQLGTDTNLKVEPVIHEKYNSKESDFHTFDGDKPKTIKFASTNGKRSVPFTAHFDVFLDTEYERAMLYSFAKATLDSAHRGQHMIIKEGKLSVIHAHFYPGEAIEVLTKKVIPTQQWIQLSVSYDGSSQANGISIYLNGKKLQTEIIHDFLTAKTEPGNQKSIQLGAVKRDKGLTNSNIRSFQMFDQCLTNEQIEALSRNDSVAQLHAKSTKLAAELQQARETLYSHQNAIPKIMTMTECRKEERKTYILNRGNFNEPTTEVTANTPKFLPPLEPSSKNSRLDLANWLTNPNHPLTARVTVNRYWQLFFGNGLVSTSEDFGNQGSLPTHPELLDWLARDFVSSGWDLHHLVRQIVLSHTYRQSSINSRKLEELDPENTLLSYFPKAPLTAEMLRDSALAISRLLSNKSGGSPVHPYDLKFSFGGGKGKIATGENLYRRSLYTYWKVNGPSPLMLTLGAAKRSVCSVKREQTSTPLKSLVLLNSPQFVEAARVTAEQILTERTKTEERCALAFRLSTSQHASDKELEILKTLYHEQYLHFKEDPQAAQKFIQISQRIPSSELEASELAAYTNLVLTLWNFAPSTIKY